MRITLLLVAAAFLGAIQDLGDHGSMSPGSPYPPRTGNALQGQPLESPATEVCLGDVAPDFSYQGVDAHWRRLHDLVADRPVLLVFGGNVGLLRILEGEREALMDLGVIPVAVVNSRLGVARAAVDRHQLRFTVLADPQGVIASQFNAVDPGNGRPLPAWFVLDTGRRVRALGRRGLPLRGYPELAAAALGLPPKGAAMPAAR